MGHWLLSIVKEGIWGPDLAGHQVVETKHWHGAFEPQSLIPPTLSEEDINGVLLQVGDEERRDKDKDVEEESAAVQQAV